MSASSISDSIVTQFRRSWDMLRDCVHRYPENEWKDSDIDFLRAPRLVVHAIEAAEFYCGESPDGFKWGHRFGDWEGMSFDELPGQEQVLAYLDEIGEKFEGWARAMSDEDILGSNDAFPWTGERVLDRISYVMRHTHQHLGEMGAELRRKDLPRPKWK
ncbi:MAG: DinB family protein [Planctomycetota bacterium]|nr:DinB family protein [Planctomycetota bacterium]